MSSALLVIDAQRSFERRPYWTDTELPEFIRTLQQLIDRCVARQVPVVQIFHQSEDKGPDDPFSSDSGLVRTLPGLKIEPAGIFHKNVHSALFGRNAHGETLEQWLRAQGVDHVIITGIRTEQCCETTARHAYDSGFRVSYALDATLTFPMVAKSGRRYTSEDLKERTQLVLEGRFAQVLPAEAISI